MGEVYLAQDTSELGRMVALKILPAEVAADKDRLQRFVQEARTVSNLNHPNILTVHEFGHTESTSFIVTEFVDGVTLREQLSGRRLKLVDILDLTIQIVAALNAAHEAGVTHRDLKPENVMVRRDHIVKVLDFGLAKLTEIPGAEGSSTPASPNAKTNEDAATRVLVRTEPGLVMGTVSYLSPEQSMGQGVDGRSDIWSVGVVLYEMIAGVVPFQGKDIHRQIISIQEAEPTPLALQVEGVPDRLEEIVAKCLAKAPDERYQSARDLLIDLRNFRRKLDVDAEIERTVAPQLRSTGVGSSRADSSPGATPSTPPAHATSNAEYVVTGIKRHKLAVAAAVLVLITGLTALGLYLRSSSTEGTVESIAVLPFENRSTDTDTEYLSDGLAESLIYRLSQLPNLKVSPTSSVMRYKGKDMDVKAVARELGVSAVMTGRITQRSESLTISVELVDGRNNKLIWGEQYDRKMSDLLATQREIASTVVEKLQLKLAGEATRGVTKRYTDNNEAYQLYLKGRYQWNKRTPEDIRKAIEHFKVAAEKDPNFALAHVGLADAHIVLLYYTRKPEAELIPVAQAHAIRALEIDDALAEAQASLGIIYKFTWDWAESEKAYKRAIELNPNYATARHWYSRYLRAVGRYDEGFAEIRKAYELDPLSLPISDNLAENLMEQGDINGAIEQCKRGIEIEAEWWAAHRTLASAYLPLSIPFAPTRASRICCAGWACHNSENVRSVAEVLPFIIQSKPH